MTTWKLSSAISLTLKFSLNGLENRRSLYIIPKRIGAEEVSPQQFQQRADALLQRHRSIEDSLLIKEAKAEIMFGDIDIISLNQFLEASKESKQELFILNLYRQGLE